MSIGCALFSPIFHGACPWLVELIRAWREAKWTFRNFVVLAALAPAPIKLATGGQKSARSGCSSKGTAFRLVAWPQWKNAAELVHLFFRLMAARAGSMAFEGRSFVETQRMRNCADASLLPLCEVEKMILRRTGVPPFR